MLIHAASAQTLSALGDDILTGATRSLRLLKDIEETISSLCYDQRYYGALTSITKETAENIRKAPLNKLLDQDGSIEEKLLRGQNAAHNLYNKLIEKRKSAISDPQLTDEDGVVDEFTRTIEIVADMHNSINELRWALGEHEADLSPHKDGLVFSTPKDIEVYLEKL